MGNMSYCQFRNTSTDFEQCLEAVGNAESIDSFSKDEAAAAEKIRELAEQYIDWYDQLTAE